MIRVLRRIVLGGVSDKREASWLIFFIVLGITIYAVNREANEIAMPNTWAFLGIAFPAAMAGVLGVHGQHYYEMVRGRIAADEKPSKPEPQE